MMTLSELRGGGIPADVLSDVESLAKIRAAKATNEQGVSVKEYVEVRETGVIGQVVAIHDEQVVLDLGEGQVTLKCGQFFSPFTFATIIAELVQEVVRVDEGAKKAAEAFRNGAAAILAPQKPLDLSFLKKDLIAEQKDGGDSRTAGTSNPTS